MDLELRRQVAEARGWTEIRPTPITRTIIGSCPPSDSGVRIGPFAIPKYETDIAAAWELLEGLHYDIDNATEDGSVAIILWSNDGVSVVDTAPTAPTAICKAYLKYKTGDTQ